MKDINEAIEVLQHFRDGGKVETREIFNKGDWGPASSPVWDFSEYEYRKKPEKKTRLMTAEELKGKWIKSWRDDGSMYLVTAIDVHRVYLSGWCNNFPDCWLEISDMVSDEFKLEDGSPLTVEVGE